MPKQAEYMLVKLTKYLHLHNIARKPHTEWDKHKHILSLVEIIRKPLIIIM